MSVVALIPAKGTSKRIPGKNIKEFCGKPILAYSIETARATGLFDQIYVSTESGDVIRAADEYGAVALLRSAELCDDQYGPLDVARAHLADGDLGQQVAGLCIVYATAPLMRAYDIQRAQGLVCNPWFAYALSVGVEPLHDAAQFIWCKPAALAMGVPEFAEFTIMVPVPPERDCDINTPEDWARAERMYAELAQ